MQTKAVTFDAEGTLVQVRFDPGRVAVQSALAAGLVLSDLAGAKASYMAEYRLRQEAIEAKSATGDPADTEAEWMALLRCWMGGQGLDLALAGDVFAAGQALCFGPGQGEFLLFPETVGCLEHAKGLGLKCAVLSNWDISLYRVLDRLGILDYFVWVGASHVAGVSKPDPRFFEKALQALGCSQNEVLHVGDRQDHDIVGATAAGLRSVLIDRSAHPAAGSIQDLMQVFDHL